MRSRLFNWQSYILPLFFLIYFDVFQKILLLPATIKTSLATAALCCLVGFVLKYRQKIRKMSLKNLKRLTRIKLNNIASQNIEKIGENIADDIFFSLIFVGTAQ